MNWRPIKGYETTHQISDTGLVKVLARTQMNTNQTGLPFPVHYRECILVAQLDSRGYPQVVLTVEKRKRTARVHRLVAEAFLPKPSPELEESCSASGTKVLVNHKDSNRTNNSVTNLEWCNPTHNSIHAVEEGNHKPAYKGSDTPWSILKESDVEEILKLKSSMSQQKIADRYGVKQVTISNIYTGRSWAWFTGIKPTPRNRKRTTPICH